MGSRAQANRTAREAREQIMTALRELGGPARFDQIVDYAIGTHRWGQPEQTPYERAIHHLVNRGDVVRFIDGWQNVYRLATDADRADREDALEVARMMSAWEPAP